MNSVALVPETQLGPIHQQELRRRLDAYYESVTDYTAFTNATAQTVCWSFIEDAARARLARKPEDGTSLRVLEVGSGRSGFGDWLTARGLRRHIHWTAQDVTPQNAEWLARTADETVVGDVASIGAEAPYDIVFSTYVLEHVTNPTLHLSRLHELLRSGGSLFIFCPRYDLPGYFCPSSRHLRALTRFGLQLQLLRYRAVTLLTGRAAFLLQTDLAAFHGPFFTDADAVHWVSLFDLQFWGRSLGLKSRRLRMDGARFLSKDWIVKRFLTCALELRKPA